MPPHRLMVRLTMPRRSGSKSKTAATPPRPRQITTPAAEKPDPTVAAKAHDGLGKPPEEPSAKDERLIGYQFPNHSDSTPFDYAVNEKTGLMTKQKDSVHKDGSPLWGVKYQDLSEGIRSAMLPPLSIWKAGRWLEDIDTDDQPIHDIEVTGWTQVESNIWLTSGEGSPGCYAFLAFFIPNEESDAIVPKHPMLWGVKFKNGTTKSFKARTLQRFAATPKDPREAWLATWEILEYGFLFSSLSKTQQRLLGDAEKDNKDDRPWRSGYGWGNGHESSPLVKTPPPRGTTTTLPGPKSPTTYTATMPVGVKFRCPTCGHWYKETDFVTHNKHSLCPGLDNGIADWTIICDDKCGCELLPSFPTPHHTLGEKTLDHVSAPKPGFPRPKREEVKTVTETTETPDEGTTEEGGESTEGTESTEGGEEAAE
jgi:hypothetical protein